MHKYAGIIYHGSSMIAVKVNKHLNLHGLKQYQVNSGFLLIKFCKCGTKQLTLMIQIGEQEKTGNTQLQLELAELHKSM